MKGKIKSQMTSSLKHLSKEQIERVEQLDNEIYELQGNLKTQDDTLRLNQLYEERSRIIRGE